MNTPSPSPESNPTCEQCGKPIIEGSPRGLCGMCLLSAVAKADGPPLAADLPEPELEDLRRAFPALEILALLGVGGMGRVYKARQPHLDRCVALKLLPPGYAENPEWIERFNREGRALARLNHPNIVQVFDFGEANAGEGGTAKRFPYLLMEYVEGVNLRQALRSGTLAAREALSIVPAICAALQYAHDRGVLHRDIKPENILLDTAGQVKIADFGLAKLGDEAAQNLTLTGTGVQLGTAAYMAPEQIEHPGAVDHRADIYSVGVVFYEMLTGELPLGRFAAPSEKSGSDPRLDSVVFRTLEKERERRFQSATEMRTEVESIANSPALDPAAAGKQPHGPREPVPGNGPAGSRLCKTAVTGAVLVSVGLPLIAGAAVIVALMVPRMQLAQQDLGMRSNWMLAMPIVVGLLGLLPALAGTICGWIGIGRIRASAGALRGAGLAVFAALFYPAWLLVSLCAGLLGRLFNTGSAAVVGVILGVALAVWAGLALWNSAERTPRVTGPRPVRWPWFVGFALLAGVIALPFLGLVVPYLAMRSPSAVLGRRPSADVVTSEHAPFVGRLPEGSAELVAISHHPSTGEPWWQMDGAPAAAGPFLNKGASAHADAGERGFEFVFRIKNLPKGAHLTSWEVENSYAWASGDTPELASAPGQPLAGHHAIAATLPATLSATDIRIGFGFGEWETVFETGQGGPGGTNPTHRGVTWQLGWSEPVETKDGETISNWTATREADWETRVIAVKNDGTEVATTNRSSANDQTTWKFSGLPYREINAFNFQVRPVQWVEFRGIKLAPAANKTRGAEVKPDASNREDELIFNARQNPNTRGAR